MAKAQFHRHQKVWVNAVGAWATIDQIIPVWAKGIDEPVRITYDVGLGREFSGNELQADAPTQALSDEADPGDWRILRARNKWQEPEDCAHHPQPGTFPIVVSDPNDWGGWRVPGAEYDRDPWKIEYQSRLIACAPKLLRVAKALASAANESPEDLSPEMTKLARLASNILRYVSDSQAPPEAADEPARRATAKR